jgi:hypothetical protein
MTNLSHTARSTTVDCFNQMLLRLNLRPVESNQNLVGDHAIAYNQMVAVYRRVAAKGWYCYNLTPRFKVPYSAGTNDYRLYNAIWAKTSERMPADPAWPQVRLETLIPGGAYGTSRLRRLDNNETSFTTAEQAQNILIDVCYGIAMDEAPEPLLTYVAAVAARELAPIFGVPVSPDFEAQAWDQLLRFESEYTPTANACEDETDTLLTWIR